MIIIWGTRLAGTVDKVPGLFYVRTQYGHLWWIPLIPIRSYIILHGSEGGTGFKGRETPLSGKSVLFGWLRTASIFGGVFGLIALIVNGLALSDKWSDETLGMGLFSVALLAGSILVYWLCEHFSHASRERAHQLASELNMPPELVDHFLAGPSKTTESSAAEAPPDDQVPPYGMPSAEPPRERDEPWQQ
jgi:hypothetical protein